MKLLSIFILPVIFTLLPDIDCEKCNLERVKAVTIESKNLSTEIVGEFLCTLDTICADNVEFSQWSNEVLFLVIENSPELFFNSLQYYNVNQEAILKGITNPLIELDLQLVFSKVKGTSFPKDQKKFKSQILATLLLAADKY